MALVTVLLTGCAIIDVEDVKVQAVAGEGCELGLTQIRSASGQESGSGSVETGAKELSGKGQQAGTDNSALRATCK